MHEHEMMRNPLAKGEVLMVCTSADRLAGSDEQTGIWLSELAVPYCAFRNAGYDVTIASPKGGQVPVDPKSLEFVKQEGDATAQQVHLFQSCETARQSMLHSVRLADIKHITMYRVVFLVGGHGASVDFPNDSALQGMVKDALNKGVVVAAVCHGNAVFASEELGKMLSGRRLTCFSDEEERGVGREAGVPFLLETRLRELGPKVETASAGKPNVVTDGNLITGQNPASAGPLAQAVIDVLGRGGPGGIVSHPGSFTAEEIAEALNCDPLLIKSPMGAPGAKDNLGPNAGPNPGTDVGNDAPASA